VSGSRLLLYTDGYPETVDPGDRPFDEERVDVGQPDPLPIAPALTPSRPIPPDIAAPRSAPPATLPQPILPPLDRATPFQFGSPFGRTVLQALAADDPETGLAMLESARERFAPGLLPADDRAAVLAWLL
jgi:hypothetical protein